ncbi:MAG: hypothetical protein RR436_06185 [Clostridia bacterium]
MKSNKFIKILSLIISFITMITIIIIAVISILNTTILNSGFIPKIIKTTNYSDLLYINVNKDINHLLGISGIPEESVSNLISLKQVNDDSVKYFEAIFSNKDFSIDKELLSSTIKKAISDYAYKQDLFNVNKNELDKNIDELTNKCVLKYEDEIMIKTIKPISKITNWFNEYKNIVFLVISIILLFEMLIISLLNRKVNKTVKYFAFSTFGSCIFLFAVAMITVFSNVISRIPLTNQSQYILGTAILTDMLTSLYFTVAILFIISLIIILLFFITYKKKSSLS